LAVREAPPWGTGLVEVAPDIYAYLQYDGSWGISNTGFLAGDDAVLVIDATLVPDMARNFIGEMRKVTDKPWRHLINTHSHPDHTGGNRVFDGLRSWRTRCAAKRWRGLRPRRRRVLARHAAWGRYR